jgi:polyhydroxyalkanoate synthase
MSNQTLSKAIRRHSQAPRPLALHLAVQCLTYVSSLVALQSLKNGSLDWKGSLSYRAKSLQKNLEKVDPLKFQSAVQREIEQRVLAFAVGVNQFQNAPRNEPQALLPSIWSEGTTQLIHAKAAGAPVILIPSLVNRAHILDLNAKRSLLRYLADAGLDTYLVDWDAPGTAEMTFSMDDYVDRLIRIRDAVQKRSGAKPTLVGYCMGGNLALALAHRAPHKIEKLALLATPWDFHAVAATSKMLLKSSLPILKPLIASMGVLPVDVMQAMFLSLNPSGTLKKFRAFGTSHQNTAYAENFIALEDWLNDGVPLVANVAIECLEDWYAENKPIHGKWRSGGQVVNPRLIDVPTLVTIPEKDTIVPPASASPLIDLLPRAEVLRLNAGHIGMIVGSKAKTLLYKPLADWICAAQ